MLDPRVMKRKSSFLAEAVDGTPVIVFKCSAVAYAVYPEILQKRQFPYVLPIHLKVNSSLCSA